MSIFPADEGLTAQPQCLFCGETEQLEIREIWTDHNFTLATCCPALAEHVAAEMHEDPRWARDLLRRLGAEALTGYALRRVTDGQVSHPVLDFQLRIVPVRFAVACAFIGRHHAHRPPPVAWRYGFGVRNGPTLLGVVTVGNPVARAYMHRGVVEVNRLCIRRDVPALLRWNGASMLLAQASREAERLGFSRVVTYTRDDEGTSLRAAGWTCEGPAGGGSWISPARPNRSASGWVPKLRWSRTLRPKARPRANAPRPAPSQAGPLWIGEWEPA